MDFPNSFSTTNKYTMLNSNFRWDWIVVGAGMTGATFARRRAELGEHILVVDKRNHVGGNCYDRWENGHLLHVYGPHLFHTNSFKVVEFLSRFTDWRTYEHRVEVMIDGQQIPLPINLNSIAKLFPTQISEPLISALLNCYDFDAVVTVDGLRASGNLEITTFAHFLYKKVFEPYSKKQWGTHFESLDPSVMGRVPVRLNYDSRYFTDKYQMLPGAGYTVMFEALLDHPNINIMLNTDYETCFQFPYSDMKVLHTGPIDKYYEYRLGSLPYRNVSFETLLNTGTPQTVPTLNLPKDPSLTRITNQSLINKSNNPMDALTSETPSEFDITNSQSDRYYPIPSAKAKALYKEYCDIPNSNITFAGRLGSYQYINIDQACAQGLHLAETL
jgi:UDP-galactopyranose mutase